jgi:hypothetical protein
MVPALREVQLVVQAEFVYTPTLTAETVPCTGTFWLADRMAEVATVRIMPVDAANTIAMIRLLCNAIVQPLNVLNRTTHLLINLTAYKYYTNTNPKKHTKPLHQQSCTNVCTNWCRQDDPNLHSVAYIDIKFDRQHLACACVFRKVWLQMSITMI